ncbi:hypothetical protein [Leifsonia aquatica]|uniref:hypothetical protein n=1 Tax=Leifsonia aquatica TaxID=144185 RepID=UPI00046A19CD|nr:hypothetical protein [Leifsonia aquatica]
MARRQAADGESFRAVIYKTLPDGTVETDIYGPYGTLGAARGMRTDRLNSARRYGRKGVLYTSAVQRCVPAWQTVPDGAPNTKESPVADKHPILDLPMNPDENDANASSIREYLGKLLWTVLYEDEGFSGKRPFGNSGWTGELEDVLEEHGYTFTDLLEAAKTLGATA